MKRIKCSACKHKHLGFKTQGALAMHERDKHPELVRARAKAAMTPRRKPWGLAFLAGVFSCLLGVAGCIAVAVVVAVQSNALTIDQRGVVTLKPWDTVVVAVPVVAKAKR